MAENVGSATSPQLFGSGFGDEPFVPGGIQQEVHDSGSGDPSSASESEDEDTNPSTVSGIAAALLRTTLEASSPSPDRDWSSVPSYSPLYLDTVSEYIAPPSATIPQVNNRGVGQGVWGGESYEPTKGIDEVFEKFVLCVGQEPQQCIRRVPEHEYFCSLTDLLQFQV
jgi:pre-rRNA-processing protein TSR4